ncbi:MAG TPA: chemotaxis protein CheB [Candidatus Obscuribacterales bacterium]
MAENAQSAETGLSVVAMAASAGGLKALSELLSGLPKGFPAAIVVVQHIDPHHESRMAQILDKKTNLTVKEARDGDRLTPSTVYIAPANRHLLVNPDHTLSLSQAELVNFVRPSADLLFESVAASFKHRAISVVLSGTGKDGAVGSKAIKRMGGRAIAQDKDSSEFFGMPSAAIEAGGIDLVLPLSKIARTLIDLLPKEETP